MFRAHGKAMHCLGTQSGAQAVDETLALFTRLTALLAGLPQPALWGA
jgi:hypothetical protein